MTDWNFDPPPPSRLGDHDVRFDGSHLEGRRIALLVTGGIAAMKAPLIARALRKQGAAVVAFLSEEGARYVTSETLEWSTVHPVVTRLTPAAEHLSDDQPFDAYLLAPATYNSINKLAAGIADGVITASAASALGRMEQGETRLLVAPTMHGSLHNSLLTESMKKLADLGVRIIPPREDYGKHNIPAEEDLVAEVSRAVSESPLKGVGVLVTGGPTPVPVDSVRLLTNRFRGTLGLELAKELHLRGADAHLVLGGGAHRPPAYLSGQFARTYDDYRRAVSDLLATGRFAAGIFSAAVADYRPTELLSGKTPSGGALKSIELEPTPKVIEEVREAFPDLHMVTFKYLEGVSQDELIAIARSRLDLGYQSVVANRGEEMGPVHEQVAYLVTEAAEPVEMTSKRDIAVKVANYLEEALRGH